MKSNFIKSILPLLILFSVFYFLFSNNTMAQDIWKNTTQSGGMETCNNLKRGCNFCDAVKVTNNIINFLVEIAIPIGVGMMVYGGIRMMTNFGKEQNITAGKSIMTNAVIGITIALAAWAIINTILHLISGGTDWPWNKIEC